MEMIIANTKVDVKRAKVMVQDYNDDMNEVEYLAMTFLDGELNGETILINELTDGVDPNTLTFDVFFNDKDEEESDKLISSNEQYINDILTNMIEIAIQQAKNEEKNV